MKVRIENKPVRGSLSLLFWWVLGIAVGFPVGMEIAGGDDLPVILHSTAVAVLIMVAVGIIALVLIRAIQNRRQGRA